MNHPVTVIVLRLIHILGGIFWVGSTVVLARFLLPSLRAVGPSGGAFMREIGQVRKLPVYLNAAAGLTILSGIGLYWRMMSLSNGTWAHSASGMTFGVGAVLAIITAIIGNTVSRPTGQRLGMLGAQVAAGGGQPTAEQRTELEALQEKLRKVTGLLATLLILSAAAMAVARYV
jgi:hypothetical protein